MRENVVDILHACPLFSRVPPTGFARLVAMARLKRFEKGTLIFRDGDECPGVFVVGSGSVRIFKTGSGGKEHVLHLVGPGQTFAEMAAIGGFPLPAAAEALAETTCVLLPTEPFRRALREEHALCLGMMTGMAFWVRQLVGLLEDIVLRDAAGRLARFLLQAPTDPQGRTILPGLKRYVASHLNLTSETFSRILRRLLDAGLVAEHDDTHLELLDRDALGQLAEGLYPRI
jgi:CRP/FNR family transcriptional regulator, dissimilatory nitrate respiration regulator